jgi:HTH-type transcriptional regulator, competence development regulator
MKLDFGHFIRQQRIKKKLSLRQFAKKLELSPAFISGIENSKNKPPKEENIKNMAEVLGVDKNITLAIAGKIPSEIKDKILSNPTYYFNLILSN